MALIECKHCGRKISDKAERCPHCGETVGAAEIRQDRTTEPMARQFPKRTDQKKADRKRTVQEIRIRMEIRILGRLMDRSPRRSCIR